MNRKQFAFILLALIVIGAAGLVLFQRNKKSWSINEAKMGDKLFPHFNFNDVATIHIKGATDLTVARKNDVWQVRERDGYPANYQQIKSLLLKIPELKIVQSEMVGPSQRGRIELDEPGKGNGSGTLVEFSDTQGKLLGSLLVGKRHARERNPAKPIELSSPFDGRYVLLPSDAQNVLLISDELASVAAEPAPWLNLDFFKAENIQDISLLSTNPNGSWEVSREKDSPWTLASGQSDETLDNAMVSQIAELLGLMNYSDVLAKSAMASVHLEKSTVMTVLTFDHFAYTLKIGARMDNGNFPMTVSVSANIPTRRVAESDEQPDAQKNLDLKFEERTKKLREKLAKEKALASWVYVIDAPIIEALVRDHSQIIQKKTSTETVAVK